MTCGEAKVAFDDDTQVILEIAVKFLGDYFNYSRSDAERLMAALLTNHAGIYDEDFIHRESSYGVAAGAHFLCTLRGRPADFRDWMNKTGHDRAPSEALEYFRRTYFL